MAALIFSLRHFYWSVCRFPKKHLEIRQWGLGWKVEIILTGKLSQMRVCVGGHQRYFLLSYRSTITMTARKFCGESDFKMLCQFLGFEFIDSTALPIQFPYYETKWRKWYFLMEILVVESADTIRRSRY